MLTEIPGCQDAAIGEIAARALRVFSSFGVTDNISVLTPYIWSDY